MKKGSKIGLLAITTGFLLVGCGNGGGSEGYITVDPESVDVYGGDSKYAPDKSKIKQYSGEITVALDFENTLPGWKEVAKEYSRLQSGKVTFTFKDELAGATYQTAFSQQLDIAATSDWDIVQGNLAGSKADQGLKNVASFGSDKNPYCNNANWSNVLSDIAFKNVESGRTDQVYIINSENMQSCWFINDTAFKAAVEQGYVNSKGEAKYPVVWDDLINLCSYMEKAGYTNPLGISLADNSIRSSQFSWLLRVYGDYFYRHAYRYTTAYDQEWAKYDPEEPDVEDIDGYAVKYGAVANFMFDEDTKYSTSAQEGVTWQHNGLGYIGPRSELYQDFITQIAKIKGHLMKDADQKELKEVRSAFNSQSSGKESPQILLDYLGNGLNYFKSDKIDCSYFDYPTMKSEKIPHDSDKEITRDIGGNGGFLSLMKHSDSTQNALNKDFLMFFLSPYGQYFFYKGLDEGNGSPTGESTVTSKFKISDQWSDFWEKAEESGITFNGNVDGNPFIEWGVRYFKSMENTESKIKELWQGLIVTGKTTISSFQTDWKKAMKDDWLLFASQQGWSKTAYEESEMRQY